MKTETINLNALIQKTGITALTSLNSILANVTRLDRLADVTLSGTPRVCITHSHYFKVFPTRAGSETPAGDRDAWKTYDDTTTSGTPKRIGFAYAGELYWAKGYPTPAATANPTADIVQNMAFAVSDDTVTGNPAVFRILSGGNYYYFKAYLDSVLQVQELCVGASLDAVLALAATTYTATALLNALIQKQAIPKTASLDALLQKTGLTGTTGLNALIRKDGVSRGGSLDALLAGVHSTTVSLNSLIQKQAIPKTTAVDSLLKKTGLTSAANLNALLQKTALTVFANLNALIRKDGLTRGGNLDALLAGIHSVAVSLNSLIQKQAIPKTAAVDSLLKKTGLTSTANLNALLAGIHSVTVSLNSLIQKQSIPKTAAMDAIVQKSQIAAMSMDALLQKVGLIKIAGLDSLLKKTGIETTESIDALLSCLAGSFATLDALLGKMISAGAEIDVLLQRRDVAAGAAMDAILLAGMGDLPIQICRACKTLYFMDESERCPKCGWIPGMGAASSTLTQDIDMPPAEMTVERGAISGALPDLPLCVCRRCGAGYLSDGQMDDDPERCPRCGWTPGKTETEKGEDYAAIY